MNAEIALVLSLITNTRILMEYNQKEYNQTAYYAEIGRKVMEQETNSKSVRLNTGLSMKKNIINPSAKL